MDVKTPVSIAMRPTLVKELDRLAAMVNQSRSATVSRLLGMFISDLLEPTTGWIKINRDGLKKTLEL